ncbi:hypothetical protein [Protofrankia coriariae]|nr:hypothetical protein [Protofrankia coriariae]
MVFAPASHGDAMMFIDEIAVRCAGQQPRTDLGSLPTRGARDMEKWLVRYPAVTSNFTLSGSFLAGLVERRPAVTAKQEAPNRSQPRTLFRRYEKRLCKDFRNSGPGDTEHVSSWADTLLRALLGRC